VPPDCAVTIGSEPPLGTKNVRVLSGVQASNLGGGGASIALSQRRDVQVFADFSAKVRPAVVVSIPADERVRALVILVPHTTSPRQSRFEASVVVPFLRPGVFDAQNIITMRMPSWFVYLERSGRPQPFVGANERRDRDRRLHFVRGERVVVQRLHGLRIKMLPIVASGRPEACGSEESREAPDLLSSCYRDSWKLEAES